MQIDIDNAAKELFSLFYENNLPVMLIGLVDKSTGKTLRAMCGNADDYIRLIALITLESHKKLAEQNIEMPPIESYLRAICEIVNSNKDLVKD